MKAYVNADRFKSVGERWSPPRHGYEGKTWRYGDRLWTILRAADGSLHATSAEVVITEGPERFPKGWRDAFAAYLRQWPCSACEVAAWANVSIEERVRIAMGLIHRSDRISRASSRRVAARILAGCRP